jgi:hypothetical protein
LQLTYTTSTTYLPAIRTPTRLDTPSSSLLSHPRFMPKKRNARHARTQATHSQNTSGRSSPAPALLDVRAGTPDVAASVSELATPEFSLGDDGRYGGGGVLVEDLDDSIADMSAPEPAAPVAVYARPSPLALSPMVPPPASFDALVDVSEPSEGLSLDIGHIRAPVIPA